mmetsp:Transcript_6745/g.11595  ORF Transcript_6745/g.11595 Transcript_6745/m.11595 type:complete len:207 (-) Transcript_6745:182-802(-)
MPVGLRRRGQPPASPAAAPRRALGWRRRDRADRDRDRGPDRAAVPGDVAGEVGPRGAGAGDLVRDDQGPHAGHRAVRQLQGRHHLHTRRQQDDHRRGEAQCARRAVCDSQPDPRQPHRLRRRRRRDLLLPRRLRRRRHGVDGGAVRHARLRRRAGRGSGGAGRELRDAADPNPCGGEGAPTLGGEPPPRHRLPRPGHQRHARSTRV